MTLDLLSYRQRLMAAATVWIEITARENKEPGSAYDLGKALWSPSRYANGTDRYAIMRLPEPGDSVLHFVTDTWPDGFRDKRVAGISTIISKFKETTNEPPRAGEWASRDSYYSISLSEFFLIEPSLPLRKFEHNYINDILIEISEDRPRYYPYARYRDSIRLVQGAYLSRATPRFLELLLFALGIEDSASGETTTDFHDIFSEGQRRQREAYFFSRNATLARRAKEVYGAECMVCGFDFEQAYGELGRGFVECHHLNPLSERAEADWTSDVRTQIGDVAVLCANCHRMIHRKRPALSLDALRKWMHAGRSFPESPS